ncbi:MAG: hypothetical protein PHD80_04055 [Candidatus ainarchaeum sp.]|nr:hypothetical protein [Candidatus ainarchaeum sp.]
MPKRILSAIKLARLKSIKNGSQRRSALRNIQSAKASQKLSNKTIKSINLLLRRSNAPRQTLVKAREALFNHSKTKEEQVKQLKAKLKKQRKI